MTSQEDKRCRAVTESLSEYFIKVSLINDDYIRGELIGLAEMEVKNLHDTFDRIVAMGKKHGHDLIVKKGG